MEDIVQQLKSAEENVAEAEQKLHDVQSEQENLDQVKNRVEHLQTQVKQHRKDLLNCKVNLLHTLAEMVLLLSNGVEWIRWSKSENILVRRVEGAVHQYMVEEVRGKYVYNTREFVEKKVRTATYLTTICDDMCASINERIADATHTTKKEVENLKGRIQHVQQSLSVPEESS